MFSDAPLTLVRASALAAALLAAGPLLAADAPAGRPAEQGAISDTDARIAAAAALGERLSKLGRYDEAVAEYRRAYELRAEPRFLYDIAECYRELGAKNQSLFYYERYLTAVPDAPERDEVLDKITELEGPRAAHPRLIMVPEPTAAQAPPWRRWWFWTGLGVAVAAGLTAVALSGRSGTQIPASDLGDRRFY